MAAASDIEYIDDDGQEEDFRRALASIPPDARNVEDARAMLRELRRLCKLGRLNLGAAWAQILHETGKLRSDLWANDTNPAGIKSRSGAFKRYRNGVDAARAYVYHLWLYLGMPMGSGLSPELGQYSYLEGRSQKVADYVRRHGYVRTLAQIARGGDGWAEDPAYADKIARIYTAVFIPAPTLPAGKPYSVLLVAGHRNYSGGNPEEAARTPALARSHLAALRQAGVWAEYLQAIDGDTDPDGTTGDLAAVAVIARDWLARQRAGDRVPVMLDIHFEGGGGSGCFAIVPDAPGDTFALNALDRSLAGWIAAKLNENTGLPIRGHGVVTPGVMSETQTGVGAQGYRLGMFAITAPARAYAVRLVVEHGGLDAQPDRGIIDGPHFNELAATALTRALAAWASVNAADIRTVAGL